MSHSALATLLQPSAALLGTELAPRQLGAGGGNNLLAAAVHGTARVINDKARTCIPVPDQQDLPAARPSRDCMHVDGLHVLLVARVEVSERAGG